MPEHEHVYILGHKNPDTDSICSAIAYADIRNRTSKGDRFVPRRAGQINEETEFVLKRFGFSQPGYMPNVGTQVKDMDFFVTPHLEAAMPLKRAWDLMKAHGITTLPVVDAEDHLEGLITVNDISQVFMDTEDSLLLSNAHTQYRWIAETIRGTIRVGDENLYFSKGRVLVGTANPDLLGVILEEGDMVILGDREGDQMEAVNRNVSCIVVGLNMEISDRVLALAREKGVVIISSVLDTFTIARLINQSIPVGYVMTRNHLVTFSTEDFSDDIQDAMKNSRYHAFPVIDPQGRCRGTISRQNLIDPKKKQIILVDHNEKDQAADNADQADILEIIDHHKLGNLETMMPITFRNQPVGCTGTIMYQIYGEQKLDIPPNIAGLLCSAIISDTLMFRSPTCTVHDKMAAGALSLIAGVDIAQLAKEMFRAGSNLGGKTPDQIFYQDYKKFTVEEDVVFGVGQISSMDEDDLSLIREKLTPVLKAESEKQQVPKVYFMLTNILKESTELIYYGENSEQLISVAFHTKPENGAFFLPGIVSRKKQLIPAVIKAAQLIKNSDFSA
ncbi:MAG: putative manganese-dependent inorganic diphosphatase [Clostridia bacterium]|nr:putative manganese-dependent inorganic diphosphatase [Clostridia bacterium]